jgi:MinD-like ATPase involved in chromosome partitioning or flagellar assembly
MHSAMSGVLANADTMIVVSSGAVDGARSASATLDWLDAHGYEELVRNSVAVINAVRPRSGKVDMQKVVDHFSRRCRAVRVVPFDPHLEEGAEISLDRLRRETRDALIELAAVVADGFPHNANRDAAVGT